MKLTRKRFFLAIVLVMLCLGFTAHADTVTLPAGIRIIDEESFQFDKALDKLIVHDGATKILSRAFAGTDLKIAELPSSITFIAEDAFDGCDDLLIIAPVESYAAKWAQAHGFKGENEEVPDGLIYFIAARDTTEYSKGECVIKGYQGEATEIVIPRVIEGAEVTYINPSAFNGNTTLTRITLPGTLREIGQNAFYSCQALLKIEIPSSVKKIGANAFQSSPALESIILHEGIEAIGGGAFSFCAALRTLYIPDSVTAIGDGIILGDTCLTSLRLGGGVKELTQQVIKIGGSSSVVSELEQLEIGEGVETLDIGAFGLSKLPNLKMVILPDSLKVIGFGAFKNASALEEIQLPENLEIIKGSAFNQCSSLKTLNIPASVKQIEASAFSRNLSLESVTLHDGLEIIGSNAFSYCASLKTLSIPDTVISLGSGIIAGDTALENLRFGGGVVELNEGITRISMTGKDSLALETLEIGEGVETLNPYFGAAIPSLRSVILPDSLKIIGASAFSGADALTEIQVPDHITNIGSSAFADCSSLRSFHLPAELEELGADAFNGCSALETIEFSSGLKKIKSGTFENCSALKKVSLAEGLKEIDNSAFAYCISIEELDIPASVEHIGDYAFNHCDALMSLTLREGLCEIGQAALAWCGKLTRLEIPDSVTSLGKDVIYADTGLVYLRFGGGVKELTGSITALWDQKDAVLPLENLVIAEGVERIGDKAFSYNAYSDSTYLRSLKELSLPSTLKEIGSSAFEGASLLEIMELPQNLEIIGNRAFAECLSLTELIVPTSVTSLGSSFIQGDSSLGYLQIDATIPELTQSMLEIDDQGGALEVVSVGSGVQKIGEKAFYGMESLMEVELFEGLKSIGAYAFSECPLLARLEVPDSVTEIGSSFIRGDLSLAYLRLGSGIPNITTSITCISGNRQDSPALETLVLAEGVETIGPNAFAYYNNANQAFVNLRTVQLPSTLKSIGNYAFRNAESLREILLPEGLERIGISAFSGCASLTRLEIPETVTEIGNSFISGAINLRFLYIAGVRAITSSMISIDQTGGSLQTLIIGSGVQEIGQGALKGFSSLESITLSSNLNSIAASALQNCTALRRITLPASVTAIGQSAFEGCERLISVDFAVPLVSRDASSDGQTGLVTIGARAFASCVKLAEIVLPDTVNLLGENAFLNCKSLRRVVLSKSMNSIKNGTFSGCVKLVSIVIPPAIEACNYVSSFYGVDTSKLTIYGESGTYAETLAEQMKSEFFPEMQINEIPPDINMSVVWTKPETEGDQPSPNWLFNVDVSVQLNPAGVDMGMLNFRMKATNPYLTLRLPDAEHYICFLTSEGNDYSPDRDSDGNFVIPLDSISGFYGVASVQGWIMFENPDAFPFNVPVEIEFTCDEGYTLSELAEISFGSGLFCYAAAEDSQMVFGRPGLDFYYSDLQGHQDRENALTAVLKSYGYNTAESLIAEDNLIVFIDGYGESFEYDPATKVSKRTALCVVLRQGKVAFASDRCSTTPDWVFVSDRNRNRANEAMDIGTVPDGIYKKISGTLHTHYGGAYPALKMGDSEYDYQQVTVIRVHSDSSYKHDENSCPLGFAHGYTEAANLSGGINVHYTERRQNGTTSDSPGSTGCMNIYKDDYGAFAAAVGFAELGEMSSGVARAQIYDGATYYQSCHPVVIVSRKYGYNQNASFRSYMEKKYTYTKNGETTPRINLINAILNGDKNYKGDN